MAGSDENNPGIIGPLNAQGGFVGGKLGGQNRRALSNINHNVIGEGPNYPCAFNKRGNQTANVICLSTHDVGKTQDPLVPVNRRITRKFAAQLANNQELSKKIVTKSRESEDCSFVDVEDSEAESESPVPMFVQHTESILDESDPMDDEVEMGDLESEDESVMDIDIKDRKNQLSVVDYIDDIYAYYKKVESCSRVPENYMEKQPDVNEMMRGILIDWLIEVHYKFELMDETLYLTVNLIDRFLAAKPILRKKLQLVGVTSLLLACKYEEVSVPVVDDLILISDKAYTRQEILDMEKLMVNTLQFNMSVPTPYVFMRRFLKAAQSDNKLELLSYFMIELCLVEYETLKYLPSLLASAAIYTAQCTLGGSKKWSKTNKWYSGYSQENLLECSRLMVSYHKKAGTGKLTGVHRKYSTSKFGYAAIKEPAHFLLETDSILTRHLFSFISGGE